MLFPNASCTRRILRRLAMGGSHTGGVQQRQRLPSTAAPWLGVLSATGVRGGPSIPSNRSSSTAANNFVSTSQLTSAGLSSDRDPEAYDRQLGAIIKAELPKRTGRLFTDPWDLEEMMESRANLDTLPDWSPEMVSRIALQKVQIHPDNIPTLAALTELRLPPAPPPHPAVQAKLYALHRKRRHYEYIKSKVIEIAKARVDRISEIEDRFVRQDAVDILFEAIEFNLRAQEFILGKNPSFGKWVERALEEYLQTLRKGGPVDPMAKQPTGDPTDSAELAPSSEPVPVFMDCYRPEFDSPDEVIPTIVKPIRKNAERKVGNMVEEWELAAHTTSKRIMIRESTQRIAKALVSNPTARIFVHGLKGVGKTASLLSIVASARTSGWIVWYLPEGQHLHRNGFYVEPNPLKTGHFDLPMLSQMHCQYFLESHATDIEGFHLSQTFLREHFTEEQLASAIRGVGEQAGPDSIPMLALLKVASRKLSLAAPTFSASMDFLMHHQTDKPFLLVVDEFNCYHKLGHYFHEVYDDNVRKPIPYEFINLFATAMNAMALQDGLKPITGRKGAVLVATTESHDVPRNVTDSMLVRAREQQQSEKELVVVEIPRLSELETEHMIAHYEAVGIGKLRLDRGRTISDEQEVAYLRMLSGGVPQKLMDGSMYHH